MLQTYEGSSPTVRPCVAAIFVTLLDSRLEVNPRLTSIPQLLVDGEKGFIESGSPDRALVHWFINTVTKIHSRSESQFFD